MPLDEKLILNDAIVIELLADGRHKLLHFRVAVYEELNQPLEEVIHTCVRVLVSKVSENTLVSIPMLRDVAMRAKNGAHADEHLVLACDVQLELRLANLSKDFIFTRRASQVGLFISDKGLELLNGGNYLQHKSGLE